MEYVRIYEDRDGISHFEDVTVPLSPVEFAPPAPPLELSALTTATGMAFVTFPVGWSGDWHPAPRRQFFLFLAGELEAETGDGESRRVGAGSVALLEDTTGSGHRSRVVGNVEVLAVVVYVPHQSRRV